MSVLSWIGGQFSKRGKALSHYRRGMVMAKGHDHAGAIDEYTLAINMSEVPQDVRAMALYNRALVYFAQGDEEDGVSDLGAVLTLNGAQDTVKARAKQTLVRMESRTRKTAH